MTSKISQLNDAGPLNGNELLELVQGTGPSLRNVKLKLSQLLSLIPSGSKGDTGDKGDTGTSIRFVSQVATVIELPDPATIPAGDYYLVGNDIYGVEMGVWVMKGSIITLRGQSAYEQAVANGFRGTFDDWMLTLHGEHARITGQVTKKEDLPTITDVKPWEYWLVNQTLCKRVGDGWVELGEFGVEGKQGKSAYDVAVDNGFVGTETEWLESLVGESGYGITYMGSRPSIATLPRLDGMPSGTSYMVDGYLWVWDSNTQRYDKFGVEGPKGDTGATGPAGAKGAKGDKGDKGDTAVPLRLCGSKPTVEDLPTVALENDGWVVDKRLYAKSGAGWVDLGNIAGPAGEQGEHMVIKGTVNDISTLPNPATVPPYEYYIVGKNLFRVEFVDGGNTPSWVDVGKFVGDDGPAGADGAKGDKGDKGEKGDKGAKGENVSPFTVLGVLASTDLLPIDLPPDIHYCYRVGDNLIAWANGVWVDMGSIVGPSGAKGDKGDKGEKGDKGVDGTTMLPQPAGPKTIEEVTALNPTVGQAWIVAGHLVVKTADALVDMGRLEGMSAYEVAKSLDPTITDEASYIASLKGAKGDKGDKGDTGAKGADGAKGANGAYFKIKDTINTVADLATTDDIYKTGEYGWVDAAGDLYTFVNGVPKNIAHVVGKDGAKGDKGDKGDTGNGLKITGTATTVDAIPTAGAVDEVWSVGENIELHIRKETGLVKIGTLRGPKGDTGATGPAGAKGDTGVAGPAGARGASIVIDVVAPGTMTGVEGDMHINTVTGDISQKFSNGWKVVGSLGAGSIPEVDDGQQYVRTLGKWVKFSMEEPTYDGYQYVRKATNGENGKPGTAGTWVKAEFVGDAAGVVDQDLWVRTKGKWVSFPTQLIASDSVGDWVQTKTGWSRFSRYDLSISTSTNIDPSKQLFYTYDMTGGAVDISGPIPGIANRACTVTLRFKGNGTVTWPTNVIWHNGAVPELSNSYTVITLVWDGAMWFGGKALGN